MSILLLLSFRFDRGFVSGELTSEGSRLLWSQVKWNIPGRENINVLCLQNNSEGEEGFKKHGIRGDHAYFFEQTNYFSTVCKYGISLM